MKALEASVKNIMASTLGLPPEEVNDSTSIDNTASWDSMTHLMLLLALEKQYGFAFTLEERLGLTHYKDIVSSIKQKLT